MSSSHEDALKRASARSQAIVSASHASCINAAVNVRASKRAIQRSRRLLAKTIPPTADAPWMNAAE